MYIYKSHLGWLYGAAERREESDCYCEQCYDYDRELGRVDSVDELINLIAESIPANPGDGGYAMEDILELIRECFPGEAVTEQYVIDRARSIKSCIEVLDRLNQEEEQDGPIGGMAWDDVCWCANDLLTKYGWNKSELQDRWPALFSDMNKE